MGIFENSFIIAFMHVTGPTWTLLMTLDNLIPSQTQIEPLLMPVCVCAYVCVCVCVCLCVHRGLSLTPFSLVSPCLRKGGEGKGEREGEREREGEGAGEREREGETEGEREERERERESVGEREREREREMKRGDLEGGRDTHTRNVSLPETV